MGQNSEDFFFKKVIAIKAKISPHMLKNLLLKSTIVLIAICISTANGLYVLFDIKLVMRTCSENDNSNLDTLLLIEMLIKP